MVKQQQIITIAVIVILRVMLRVIYSGKFYEKNGGYTVK